MTKRNVTYARHDVAHCLTPGLFRGLKRGERKRGKLDITYQFGKGESLRFVGFEPLGADDMQLLQGIVALAGPGGLLLKPDPKTDTGRQLRLLLDPRFEAAEKDALVVRENIQTLLTEIGRTDGGENIRGLKASLLRMSNVTVLARKDGREAAFQLMSHAYDEDDGRLWIGLNPRVTEAVLGRTRFARIEMAEVRGLQSDAARLIHQRLCGWINAGQSGRLAIDKLCAYVWPDEASDSTMRRRRSRIRKVLPELEQVGWKANEYAKGRWAFKRPKTPP